MLTKTGKIFIAILCLLLLLNISGKLSAQVLKNRIIGGTRFEAGGSPFAVVASSEVVCSGTLIAPNLILTAAHCITDIAANFQVELNYHSRAVRDVLFNQNFDHSLNYSLSQASEDLGIVVLQEVVTDVSPIPVVFNLPAAYTVSAQIVGFGGNENSAYSLLSTDNARVGDIVINSLYPGLIYFNSTQSAASLCAGDSGGALIQKSADGRSFWLIGVNVAGTNKIDESGNCISGGSGASYSVSLQSEDSVRFLSAFPDIAYVNGADAVSNELPARINQELRQARTEALSELKLRLKALSILLRQIYPLLSEKKAGRVRRISRRLKQASLADNRRQLMVILRYSDRVAGKLGMT